MISYVLKISECILFFKASEHIFYLSNPFIFNTTHNSGVKRSVIPFSKIKKRFGKKKDKHKVLIKWQYSAIAWRVSENSNEWQWVTGFSTKECFTAFTASHPISQWRLFWSFVFCKNSTPLPTLGFFLLFFFSGGGEANHLERGLLMKMNHQMGPKWNKMAEVSIAQDLAQKLQSITGIRFPPSLVAIATVVGCSGWAIDWRGRYLVTSDGSSTWDAGTVD